MPRKKRTPKPSKKDKTVTIPLDQPSILDKLSNENKDIENKDAEVAAEPAVESEAAVKPEAEVEPEAEVVNEGSNKVDADEEGVGEDGNEEDDNNDEEEEEERDEDEEDDEEDDEEEGDDDDGEEREPEDDDEDEGEEEDGDEDEDEDEDEEEDGEEDEEEDEEEDGEEREGDDEEGVDDEEQDGNEEGQAEDDEVAPVNEGEGDNNKNSTEPVDDKTTPSETSDGGSNIEIAIQRKEPVVKKCVLMGLSTEENALKVMEYLDTSVNGYIPSITTVESVSDFLNNNVSSNFRISNDSILTQRLSIYTQLYRKPGLFINPAVHRELKPTFDSYLNNREGNIFFLLDKVKNQAKRIATSKKHSIRQGKPDREIHVSAHFIYSKQANHPFWKDLLQLYQRRYDQTVPNGERIDSITTYGRSYLSGADLLSENIHKATKLYDDVVILEPDEYMKFVSKAVN